MSKTKSKKIWRAIAVITMAILLVISGYMLGQIPMMNNQAEQFEEMNNEIQYGFLDCILSLSYSIDNYYLQDEGLDFIDQAMGYLLNSTDANVIREHSGYKFL